MDAFYSNLYYKTNPMSDELINIGLFAGGGEGPFFYISSKRLNLCKQILHPKTYQSLKRNLFTFNAKVDDYRENTARGLLFDPVFSKEQFALLSTQSKGSILYSTPTSINHGLDEASFESLIYLIFRERKNESVHKRNVFHLKWRAYYHSNIFEKWNRDISLQEINKALPLTLKVDLYNIKDKKIVKGIDFDLAKNTLRRKLYEIELIHNALPKQKFVLVYRNPRSKSGRIERDKAIEKFNQLDFVLYSEFIKNSV